MDSKTERVGKLLALAERASTIEEAQAFYSKAAKIAADYSIDLAIARAAVGSKEKRETPVARTINIGKKGQHANKPLINLIHAIAEANDVSILIYNSSTRVIATGFPADLDTVESLWMSAAATMARLGDELIRDKNAAWRTETVRVHEFTDWGSYTGTIEKPVGGKGARRSFCDGFIDSFGKELKAIRKAAIVESDDRNFRDAVAEIGAAPTGPTGTALVLKEKKDEVMEAQQVWYKAKHGANAKPGTWSGESSARRSTSMTAQGRAAGTKAAKDISSPTRPAIAS